MEIQSSVPFPFLSNGVTQVAWVVEDVHESVRRFHELTGIGPWHFYTYGAPLLHTMKVGGKDVEYKLLNAVANAGPTRLELIQPLEGPTIFDEFVRVHGYGGIHHLGLAVPDMKSALEVAHAAGLTVTMEGGGHGPDGDGYFAYLDTERIVGVALELMERPKRRHPPEEVYPNPDA